MGFHTIISLTIWLHAALAFGEVVQLEERFEVIGVISETSNDQKQSGIAVLRDLARDKKTLVVRGGDAVPGYPTLIVTEIRRKQVTISDGKSSQILSYQGFQSSRAGSIAANDAKTGTGSAPINYDDDFYPNGLAGADNSGEFMGGSDGDPFVGEAPPPPPTSDGQRVGRAVPVPDGQGRTFENWRDRDSRADIERYTPGLPVHEAPPGAVPHPDDF